MQPWRLYARRRIVRIHMFLMQNRRKRLAVRASRQKLGMGMLGKSGGCLSAQAYSALRKHYGGFGDREMGLMENSLLTVSFILPTSPGWPAHSSHVPAMRFCRLEESYLRFK